MSMKQAGLKLIWNWYFKDVIRCFFILFFSLIICDVLICCVFQGINLFIAAVCAAVLQ